MGILDGGLQAAFGAAFGGLYLDGWLIKSARVEDDVGDVAETTTTTRVKVQKDSVTERLRGADGYTSRSVRFLILQTGPDGLVTRPNSDCRISVGGETWSLSNVSADPGNTYWEALGNPA